MDSGFWRFPVGLGLFASLLSGVYGQPQSNTPRGKVPPGVLIVKGAWASASDSTTPNPEGGGIVKNVYKNAYFGLSYPMPQDWIQKYQGPPPSDSGSYVLAQIIPAETSHGAIRGSVLIAAQDLFFTLTGARNPLELMDYTRDHLGADYQVEMPPTKVRVADHSFVRFDYFSPVAGLHWYILATQTRCHVVQFVFTSRDTNLLDTLVRDASTMKLAAQAGPVCIKDYATGENVLEREDPIFAERSFNPVPVRIVIDENGKVKHIHFLSAFPSQAKAITDALQQWRFKPYLRDGQPREVETGIMFGHAPREAAARRE
jgi:hypothetical protein